MTGNMMLLTGIKSLVKLIFLFAVQIYIFRKSKLKWGLVLPMLFLINSIYVTVHALYAEVFLLSEQVGQVFFMFILLNTNTICLLIIYCLVKSVYSKVMKE